ncbi:hypothetical protein ACFQWF_28695 [Methylorubrum suomiense]
MDHVRPEAPHRFDHAPDPAPGMRCLDGRTQAIDRPLDVVVGEDQRLDRAARAGEGRGLALHHGILTAANLILIVDDEDTGAHRFRPPPETKSA